MNDSGTKGLINQTKESTSNRLTKQSPEWITPTSITHLKVRETVTYENRLATVTFICAQYVVITPWDQTYGVCVAEQHLFRVKQISTGTGQLPS